MSNDVANRRTVLRGTALAAFGGIASLAGCTGDGESGEGGEPDEASPTPSATDADGSTATETADATTTADSSASGQSFGGWFDDVDNYDGIVDETGTAEVPVKVGTEANDGYYGFGPAAVRISTGTTVTWEWTGRGASHNVVANDRSFESELVAEAGHTFESTGTRKYYCEPHRPLGMKGAVIVE